MTQTERLTWMIARLTEELPDGVRPHLPCAPDERFRLWRSLVNVRAPKPIGRDYLDVQDAYLQELSRERGVVTLAETEDRGGGLYLWQGDITRLSADAIVNAANSGMTGCYAPNHACIDNCIHTYAGMQLREACAEMMRAQGYPEPTGGAKRTRGYNLPAGYVLHTVGPIVTGRVTKRDADLLASCYRACLELAEQSRLSSIAFCCISTGEFRFPRRAAAEIAVRTARDYLAGSASGIKVIFNVFKEEDYAVYNELLR